MAERSFTELVIGTAEGDGEEEASGVDEGRTDSTLDDSLDGVDVIDGCAEVNTVVDWASD